MAQTSEDRLPCDCVLYTDPDDHDDRGYLEHCLRHERDCDDLGLTDDQYAALTGFSGRAIRALAHLREAWSGADAQNAACVARAIHALLESHSTRDISRSCERVLGKGLDDGRRNQFLVSIRRATE